MSNQDEELEQNQDPLDENRPGTSLRNKRLVKTQEGNRPQRTKVQQEGNLQSNANFFQSSNYDEMNSNSSFRPISMQTTNEKKAYQDLGFENPTNQHGGGMRGMQLARSHQNFFTPNQYNNSLNMSGGSYLQAHSSKVPKNIMIDQELLYAELLQAQSLNNMIAQENYKLKTQVYQKEEEFKRLLKRDTEALGSSPLKIVYHISQSQFSDKDQQNDDKSKKPAHRQTDLMRNLANNEKPQSQSSMIMMLKKQNQVLSDELQVKESEIAQVQRNVKLTKLSELQFEIQSYKNETIRLRNMLQRALDINQNQFFPSSQNKSPEEERNNFLTALDNLRRDNVQMASEIQQLQQKIYEGQKRIKDLQKQNQKTIKQKIMQKRILIERQKELDKLKGADPFLNPNAKRSTGSNERNLEKELENQINECNQLTTQLSMSDRKIQDLEKTNAQLIADHQDKLNQEIKQKQQLQLKSEKQSRELQELREKLYQLQFNRQNNAGRQGTIQETYSMSSYARIPTTNEIEYPLMTPSNSQMPGSQTDTFSTAMFQKKRLPQVVGKDIQMVGLDLKYSLLLKKINLQFIDTYLYQGDLGNESKTQISIGQFKEALMKDPFNITNEENALKIARYVIEDNKESHVIFDVHKTEEKLIINSIFKSLVHNYTLFSEEETNDLHQEMSSVLTKAKMNIMDLANKIVNPKEQNPFLSRSDFEEVLKALDHNFNSRQVDYVFMKLFENSKDANKIFLNSVFQTFDYSKYASYHQGTGSQEHVLHDKELHHHNESPLKGQVKAVLTISDFQQNKNSSRSGKDSEHQEENKKNSLYVMNKIDRNNANNLNNSSSTNSENRRKSQAAETQGSAVIEEQQKLQSSRIQDQVIELEKSDTNLNNQLTEQEHDQQEAYQKENFENDESPIVANQQTNIEDHKIDNNYDFGENVTHEEQQGQQQFNNNIKGKEKDEYQEYAQQEPGAFQDQEEGDEEANSVSPKNKDYEHDTDQVAEKEQNEGINNGYDKSQSEHEEVDIN